MIDLHIDVTVLYQYSLKFIVMIKEARNVCLWSTCDDELKQLGNLRNDRSNDPILEEDVLHTFGIGERYYNNEDVRGVLVRKGCL